MKRILNSSLALACLFLSTKTFSQNTSGGIMSNPSACDQIIENFATNPNTRGFSMSGFAWSGDHTSAESLRIGAVTSSTDYIVTTPGYSLTTTGSVRLGFSLSSPTPGSNDYFVSGNHFVVKVEVLNTSETTVFATLENLVISNQGTFCIQMFDTDLVSGMGIKYRIFFTSSAGVNGTRIVNFDNFSISSNQQIVLPVTFMSFTANRVTNGNLLTWNVSGESNVNRYEVERSSNGKSYNVIGRVTATLSPTYTFTDGAPLTGANYYRIRSIDNDGKFKLSPVVQIRSSTKGSTTLLRAYPSPATTTLSVEHDSYVSGTGLQLIGIDGRVVNTIVPTKDAQRTQVNISNLRPGMYFIQYENRMGEVESLKFIKQ